MRPKVQRQGVYGAPSDRMYYRLRLPKHKTGEYVAEYGNKQHIWAESPDTLCIGPKDGISIRILDVRELRHILYKHHWQVMFPLSLSYNMRGGERVDVSYDNDTIRLLFERDLFDDNVDKKD